MMEQPPSLPVTGAEGKKVLKGLEYGNQIEVTNTISIYNLLATTSHMAHPITRGLQI